MSTTRSARFTLIELLVVIAIISILMAMLLPALARARDLVRVNGCASNMRSIGLSFELYSDDFGDWLPLTLGPSAQFPLCVDLQVASRIGGTNPNSRCYWVYKVAPYIGDNKLIWCNEQACVDFTRTNRWVATTYGTSMEMEGGGTRRCWQRSRITKNTTLMILGHATRPDPDQAFIHMTMVTGGAPVGNWWPGWHGLRLPASAGLPVYLLGADPFLLADGHTEVFSRDYLEANPQHWDPY